MKRIFISKNEGDLGNFGQFCEENKLTLIAKSLITFEEVDFKLTSEFDCVFFSSIRAAIFFLEKNASDKSVVDILRDIYPFLSLVIAGGFNVAYT